MRRVRRACGVVAVFQHAQLQLLAPTTGRRIPAAEGILKALRLCPSWTPLEEVPLEEDGVEYLLRVGLLVEEGTYPAEQDASIRSWEPWGHETISYHFRARRQFLDYPVAQSLESGMRGSPPPPVKSYPGSPRIALPAIGAVNNDFDTTLHRRRTGRQFDKKPLPLQQCATLLGLAFGATERVDSNPFGEHFLRTSPSAGARQPVEAYICALNIEGLNPDIYHYAVLEHALEQLDIGVPPRTILSYMGDLWVADAPLVCFLTAVVERCRWRYPFGRMYRTLLLDVGHIAQTFVLTATALGLAAFQTAAFKDPLIEDALKLNPALEPLLYAVGAGV